MADVNFTISSSEKDGKVLMNFLSDPSVQSLSSSLCHCSCSTIVDLFEEVPDEMRSIVQGARLAGNEARLTELRQRLDCAPRRRLRPLSAMQCSVRERIKEISVGERGKWDLGGEKEEESEM